MRQRAVMNRNTRLFNYGFGFALTIANMFWLKQNLVDNPKHVRVVKRIEKKE
jgi:uncharacterized membrane protein YciS (DUF1049 family)